MIKGNIVVEESKQSYTLTNSSINNTNTTPVFIGIIYDQGVRVDTDCIKKNSWFDFINKYDIATGVTVKITENNYSITYKDEGPLAPALKLYFDNGGSPCYVISGTSFAALSWRNNLIKEITKYKEEINIICLASPTSYIKDVYGSVNELLKNSNDFFLIANACSGFKNDLDLSLVKTRTDQTAVYYPPLQTNYRDIRIDKNIPVSGYDDVKYLSDLMEIDKELYLKIANEIDNYFSNLDMPYVMPAAAVAATYYKTDSNYGSWKAPANIVINNAQPIFSPTEENIKE